MFAPITKTTVLPHRVAEVSGVGDGGHTAPTHGLVACTKVVSNLGMRAIEAVTVGDKLLTLDHGMQEVVAIRRHSLLVNKRSTGRTRLPVHVPVGALGNRVPLMLLADQGVHVESRALEDTFGQQSFVLPAQALVGLWGIRRAEPVGEVEMVTLYFAQEQVIYIEAATLIHCPTQDAKATGMLSLKEATLVVECLAAEADLEMSEQSAVA